MKVVNLKDIEELGWKSPKGKYHSFGQQVSEALGRDPNSLDLAKRHPFDLEIARIPAGVSMCPLHSHSAQWELYLVISGRGIVRDDTGKQEVTAGDAFIFQPGEAHQISNPGDEDFKYYVIADNPIGDSCYYPDSKKWSVSGDEGRMIVKGQKTDYFDGEE